ncbi:MAG: hypothetical protein KJ915_02310 [Candidatus Omnitrophica bacterium]|nr:hypothetical protein [Candidatus Omnitrophota bacterium]
MNSEFAKKLFLGKQPEHKRLNCAQAIAQTFKLKYSFITDQTIKEFKRMGFGKAPKGECGMLYAAKYIFENNQQSDKAQKFEQEFIRFAGSNKCSEIIKKKIAFCAECVSKTAEFIDQKKKEK